MMKDASTAFCDVEVLVVCKSGNKLPFFVEIVDFCSLICLRFSVTSARHFLLCCKLFLVAYIVTPSVKTLTLPLHFQCNDLISL